ncbi:MAG: twin-arginine translocase TatA/TatE family subunit [Pseudopedobacter sp.]|nr:twin-arginine translocase TatA/TatE family subunit [Deinococcales bacterium]
MFGNIGLPEVLIVLVVVLLIFGPKKLPELAKGIGQSMREFRKGSQGLKDELEGSFKDDPKSANAPVHTAQVHSVPDETIVITPSSVSHSSPVPSSAIPQKVVQE